MNAEREPYQKVAEQWAHIASDGLCEDARACIRREVKAHVEDAKTHYASRGLSNDDALAAAVLDLGDPSAARRGFRRTYLTEKEYQYLHRNQPRPNGQKPWKFEKVLNTLFTFNTLFLVLWVYLWTVQASSLYRGLAKDPYYAFESGLMLLVWTSMFFTLLDVFNVAPFVRRTPKRMCMAAAGIGVISLATGLAGLIVAVAFARYIAGAGELPVDKPYELIVTFVPCMTLIAISGGLTIWYHRRLHGKFRVTTEK